MNMLTRAANFGAEFARMRMTQQCRVTMLMLGEFDHATGDYVDDPVLLYEGPCELVSRQAAAKHSSSGERDLVLSQPQLRIPAETPGAFPPGCEVVVTTANGDVRARVIAEEQRPHRTARRFQLEVLE